MFNYILSSIFFTTLIMLWLTVASVNIRGQQYSHTHTHAVLGCAVWRSISPHPLPTEQLQRKLIHQDMKARKPFPHPLYHSSLFLSLSLSLSWLLYGFCLLLSYCVWASVNSVPARIISSCERTKFFLLKTRLCVNKIHFCITSYTYPVYLNQRR